METDIQNAKIELIKWLTTLEDNAVIQKIMDLKQNESQDWWNDISDDEKESIENGLSDADKGKLKPISDAQKVYEKWL